MSGLKYVPFYLLVLNMSALFIGLKYVGLGDVSLKDVSKKMSWYQGTEDINMQVPSNEL